MIFITIAVVIKIFVFCNLVKCFHSFVVNKVHILLLSHNKPFTTVVA